MGVSYVGSRLTRDAKYTPAGKSGMLQAAARVIKQFAKPQKIDPDWWDKKLGFLTAYTNGTTPWDTLRVMMSKNTDAGNGVGTLFVRFDAGFIGRAKYDMGKSMYHRDYGKPIMSSKRDKLRYKGDLAIVTMECCNPDCKRCNDVVIETD